MVQLLGSDFADTATASQFGGFVTGFILIGGTADDLADARGDLFQGRGGVDTISAGPGNDAFEIYFEDEPDILDGNAGNDSLSFILVPDHIMINLPSNIYSLSSFAGTYSIESVEFIFTGSGDDTIFGTAASEIFDSGFGNDNISGGGGDDFINGAENSDTISGGIGFDELSGGAGNDRLNGDSENDVLNGNADADTLFGGAGNDLIDGGLGIDSVDGGAGVDTATYINSAGPVGVNLFNGTAFTGGSLNSSGFYQGGALEDTITLVESLVGSEFGDRLVLSNSNGRIDGRAGNDNISGLNGNDTLLGSAGSDTLSGGAGNDVFEFRSSFGNDRILDFVEGSGVADVIRLVGLGSAFNTFAEIIATAAQSGTGVLFSLGSQGTFFVENSTVSAFVSDDFSFG